MFLFFSSPESDHENTDHSRCRFYSPILARYYANLKMPRVSSSYLRCVSCCSKLNYAEISKVFKCRCTIGGEVRDNANTNREMFRKLSGGRKRRHFWYWKIYFETILCDVQKCKHVKKGECIYICIYIYKL